MEQKTWQKKRNEQCEERHQLSIERLQMIRQEETVKEQYRPYFRMCADFLLQLESIRKMIEDTGKEAISQKKWKLWNQELYVEILGENYRKSFANPAYAVEILSEGYGRLLSFLYTELRSGIPYAFENRQDYLTILHELFLEVYQCFEAEGQPEYKSVKEIIYWYASDYCDVFLADYLRESVNPNAAGTMLDQIRNMEFSDDRFLYFFGDYVGKQEIEMAEWFRGISEEDLQKTAEKYTARYQEGCRRKGKNLVQIVYRTGFEQLIRAVADQLEKLGIHPAICRPVSGVIVNPCTGRGVNRQYDADHRMDQALFLDKKYIERKLDVMKHGYECEKEWTVCAAGCIRFDLVSERLEEGILSHGISYTEEQKEWVQLFEEKSAQLMNQYGLDITTPYEELEEISVLTKEGKNIILLKDGRFVFEGSQMSDGSF